MNYSLNTVCLTYKLHARYKAGFISYYFVVEPARAVGSLCDCVITVSKYTVGHE